MDRCQICQQSLRRSTDGKILNHNEIDCLQKEILNLRGRVLSLENDTKALKSIEKERWVKIRADKFPGSQFQPNV